MKQNPASVWFLYVMYDTQYCKIGISVNPQATHKQRRSLANLSLQLRTYWPLCGSFSKARRVENWAHEYLREFHVEGEWFAISAEEAQLRIEAAFEPYPTWSDCPKAAWAITPIAAGKYMASLSPEERKRRAANAVMSQPAEQRAENGRKGALARMQNSTREERIAAAVWANNSMTPEQRSERARKANQHVSIEIKRERMRKAQSGVTREQRQQNGVKGAAVRWRKDL